MITCQLCHKQVHSIQIHLKKDHGAESDMPCDLKAYQEIYPDAPLLSETARAKIESSKKKQTREEASKSTEATPKVESQDDKDTLRELFDLGDVRGAKNSRGDDIPVDVFKVESFEEYVPSIDENYIFDVENLKTALMGVQSNIPTFAYGHAGVGKSTLFEQICARTNRQMVRVQHDAYTESSHIVGQWTVVKERDESTGQLISTTKFELGALPLAMKHGWVFLADEFDRAYPSVLSVYQAVLEGKPLYLKEADEANRVIKPHPNFRFVATGNTNGSGDEHGLYSSTVQQDAATFERFGIVMRVNYMSPKKEAEVIDAQTKIGMGVAEKIVEFCTMIRDDFPNNISLTLGPRVAINIAKIGYAKGDLVRGVEFAYANRLPQAEREAALQVANRIFGE